MDTARRPAFALAALAARPTTAARIHLERLTARSTRVHHRLGRLAARPTTALRRPTFALAALPAALARRPALAAARLPAALDPALAAASLTAALRSRPLLRAAGASLGRAALTARRRLAARLARRLPLATGHRNPFLRGVPTSLTSAANLLRGLLRATLLCPVRLQRFGHLALALLATGTPTCFRPQGHLCSSANLRGLAATLSTIDEHQSHRSPESSLGPPDPEKHGGTIRDPPRQSGLLPSRGDLSVCDPFPLENSRAEISYRGRSVFGRVIGPYGWPCAGVFRVPIGGVSS